MPALLVMPRKNHKGVIFHFRGDSVALLFIPITAILMYIPACVVWIIIRPCHDLRKMKTLFVEINVSKNHMFSGTFDDVFNTIVDLRLNNLCDHDCIYGLFNMYTCHCCITRQKCVKKFRKASKLRTNLNVLSIF